MTVESARLLGLYLNDHYLGANAGVSLAHRAARTHEGTAAGPELRMVADEIRQDLGSLTGIMTSLGVVPSKVRAVAGMAVERVGRVKLNGHLLTRSPLSSVIELEGLRIGVEAKKAGWVALRSIADTNPRLDSAQLDHLVTRAERQSQVLERLRLAAVATAFT